MWCSLTFDDVMERISLIWSSQAANTEVPPHVLGSWLVSDRGWTDMLLKKRELTDKSTELNKSRITSPVRVWADVCCLASEHGPAWTQWANENNTYLLFSIKWLPNSNKSHTNGTSKDKGGFAYLLWGCIQGRFPFPSSLWVQSHWPALTPYLISIKEYK